MDNVSMNGLLREAEKSKNANKLADAAKLYQQVLVAFPKNPRAQKGLAAVNALASRNLPADASPADLEKLRAFVNAAQFDEALKYGQYLLRKTPKGHLLNTFLGATAFNLGRLPEAVEYYRRSVNANPNDHEAVCNLGVCLQSLLQFDAALQCFDKAVLLQPDYAVAYKNAGVVLKRMSKFNEAEACLKKAIDIRPDLKDSYLQLGLLQSDMGNGEAAEAQFGKYVELFPESAIGFQLLGQTQAYLGSDQAARTSFARASELAPHSFEHTFSAALVLGRIPSSVDDIASLRHEFRNGLAKIHKMDGIISHPERKISTISFPLSYHNSNNREILIDLCKVLRKTCPNLNYIDEFVNKPSGPGLPIRIGICSQYFSDHTISNLFGGFISGIDRQKFEVTIIHAPKSKSDQRRKLLNGNADHVLLLPETPIQQQKVIAKEKFDVILFPDIGMSADTYYLAFSRLAPVQAVGWGHPDTSGIDTLDYFVSSSRIEPPGSHRHYSERRILLDRLPCHYTLETSDIPPLDRSDFGLPELGALYGCPQTLFKFHPDFDAVLAQIAVDDPDGHIVLIEGRTPSWIELLRKRWEEHHPILNERVIFLPGQPRIRFLALLNLVDVLLDPIHFGSGNTLYEAMVFGTPIVTWPGRFMRGRIVAGAYHQMGVADAPIAENLHDYARLAVALGRDTDRRNALRVKLKDAARRELFEDKRAIRDLEAFFEAAVQAANRGEKLPDGWGPDLNAMEVQ